MSLDVMSEPFKVEPPKSPRMNKAHSEVYGPPIENSIVPTDLLMDMLKEIPAFARAKSNEEFIQDLCSVLRIRYHQAGDTIVKQGEIAKAMFFVIKGVASVVSDDSEICFAELSAPSFFGEIGILLQVARTATVRAKSKCLLATLLAEDLHEKLHKYPDVATEILQEAKDRYDALAKELERTKGLKQQTEVNAEAKKELAHGSLKDFRNAKVKKDETPVVSPLITLQLHDQLPSERVPSIPSLLVDFEPGSKSNSRQTLEEEDDVLEELVSPVLHNFGATLLPPSDMGSLAAPSSNPMVTNLLMRHGGGPRRASVAVWSDDKLQQMLQNINNQSASTNNNPIPTFKPAFARPISSLKATFAASEASIATSASISSLGNVYGKLGKEGLLALLERVEFATIFKLRGVSKSVMNLIAEEGSQSEAFSMFSSFASKRKYLNLIDVSSRNKKINDTVLTDIVRFCGPSIVHLNLKNCWAVTDKGLQALAGVATKLTTVDLSSVWDSTDLGICTLARNCPRLQKIDLSNCRKLTDISIITLLNSCPELNYMMLSYCKNLTEKIFDHAGWSNVRKINIQRCTAISDVAFDIWNTKYLAELRQKHTESQVIVSDASLPNEPPLPIKLTPISFHLIELNLSDCSFLTDTTVLAISKTCAHLSTLSLSFCCALTEKALDYLTVGCPELETLDVSFCGTAVSDGSMRDVGIKLKKLIRLSVRGCIQVTDVGVAYLCEHAKELRALNVSQCKGVTKGVAEAIVSTGIASQVHFAIIRDQSGWGNITVSDPPCRTRSLTM